MTTAHPHALPIWPTLAAAYREWRRMLPVLRPLVINAFLIVVAISALDEFIPAKLSEPELSGTIITLVEAALRALLLAPIVAAIHRFIILEEITKAYALPLGEAGFRRFFAWLFVIELLGGLPIDFLGLMQALNVSVIASTVAFVVAIIAAFVLMLRLSILPPAIAVGAPGARPAQALADTKGYVLRILVIFVLALIPWLTAGLAGIALIGRGIEVRGSLSAMIGLLLGGVMQTASLTLMAVIASLLFIALAVQVRRPGGGK
ncbi:MAG: hypothetical protein WBW35_00915 [Xanthobacteraceae bacterium]